MLRNSQRTQAAKKPDDGTFAGALRGLQDRDFLDSVKNHEQQSWVNRKGVHPWMLDFERAFIKRLRKFYIPVFTRTIDTERSIIEIVHSLYGDDLTEKQWLCISHIGAEVAASPLCYRAKITWRGIEGYPSEWYFGNLPC